MKFKISGQWSDGYKHDGMLYFAQKTEEMLFYYTNHMYKVPVYNSYYLMWEYLHTCQLVKEKAINEGHLKYILEEFLVTFENDIVIKNNMSEDRMKYITQTLNSSVLLDIERIMHYLFHYFDDYDEMCVDYLKKIIVEPKEKKKIERAIRCYLPTLLNGGYSQEFIYKYNNKFWNNENISSTKVLDEYFSRFDFKQRKYKVYICLDKKVKQFKKIFETRLNANFEKDKFSSKLKYDKNKYLQLSFEVEELDENKAAQRTYDIVNLFLRFYKFLGNRRDEWYLEKCLVVDENEEFIITDILPSGYSYSEDFDDKTIGRNSEVLITALLNNAHNSFGEINKLLKIHNTAINDSDMQNSFLNLWSIVEIIGVNKRVDSKMTEIEEAVMPVLFNDYIVNIFEELHDYIKANIEEEKYQEIISDVDLEADEYGKIAYIVILKKYDVTRKKLIAEFENYPLIRSRISQLHDIFNEKNGYYNESEKYDEKYERRVRWHLRRMYRTRNAIIHSGEDIDNLKALGEHLHSYVDELLYEITIQLAIKHSYCTIDNVLINEKFKMDETKKIFKGKDEITYDDILRLFAR